MLSLYTPIFTRKSKPEALGFPDTFQLITGDIVAFDNIVLEGPCGTNPNPKRFADGAPWIGCFAQICCGKYPFVVAHDQKHGMHLILNPQLCADGSYVGGQVPTNNANANHGGAHYADGVLCHKADNDYNQQPYNRGSMACLTIPEPYYTPFFSYYKIGDTGNLLLQEEPIA